MRKELLGVFLFNSLFNYNRTLIIVERLYRHKSDGLIFRDGKTYINNKKHQTPFINPDLLKLKT